MPPTAPNIAEIIADLEGWARAHLPVGSTQTRQILAIVEEYHRQRELIASMASRISAQSELLARRAEACELTTPPLEK